MFRKIIKLKRFQNYSIQATAKKKLQKKNSNFCSVMEFRKISNSIVWMDMEMTGLNIKTDKILELSCLITDKNLNIVAECQRLVFRQPESVLNSMNDWSTRQHAESGLTEECRNSKTTVLEAENILLEFLQSRTERGDAPLAGNTIYMDRLFLREFMPKVDEHLHYRVIDVSSIKEMCKRWNSSVFARAPKKVLCHRSLEDIKESIAELKYYKSNFLIVK